jgi:recombination endonuclease VII
MNHDVPEGYKYCPACLAIKPFSDFPKHRSRKDGVASRCKPCSSKASMESAKRHPEKHRAIKRRWRANNPKSHRAYILKRLYGLTLADYDALLVSQIGGCAICTRPPIDDKLLHVDHDHKTGQVRGLLCQQCNHAVGLFQENVAFLSRAISYLS